MGTSGKELTKMPPYTFKTWLSDHQEQELLVVRRNDCWPWWQPREWRVDGWLPSLWYYLKCRFWRHYNRLEIGTLPPTWTDADDRLLHGAFAILGDGYRERASP